MRNFTPFAGRYGGFAGGVVFYLQAGAGAQTGKALGAAARAECFFSGSLEAAVAAYLTEHQDDLNPDELEKMAALIRKARKEGR